MKKFLGILLAYAALVVGITLAVNALYVKVSGYSAEEAKFQSVPDNIQVCNLGSSHGVENYLYKEESDCISFNFALSSQYLSYDYRILQHFQEKLAEDCVVFVNVSYFSLFGTAEEEQDEFVSKNMRYYSFLPPEQIKAFDRDMSVKAWLSRYLPATTAGGDLPKVFLEALLGRGDEAAVVTADDIDLAAETAHTVQNHIVHNRRNQDGQLLLNEEELQALYDILALCEEKGWKAVLVTTPLLQEHNEEIARVDPGFKKSFYGLLEQVLADTGAEYRDYSSDERFGYDHSLFLDDDHLNPRGAEIFTDLLVEEFVRGGNGRPEPSAHKTTE